MRSIRAVLVICLLLTAIPAAVCGIGPRQTGLVSNVGTEGDSIVYPVAEAAHRTSQIEASVSCAGGMGLYGGSDPCFLFPADGSVSYLFSADIWVGGIVNGDTAVSTSRRWQYMCDDDQLIVTYGQELYPPSSTGDQIRHLRPLPFSRPGMAFRTESVDTFTAEYGLQSFNSLPYYPHRPMGISVVQKSYTVDEIPYSKILLLDYIINNISEDTIRQVWMGLFADPDCFDSEREFYDGFYDDLVGSLRDISSCYGLDNDGDPDRGMFFADHSVIDAVGLRPVRIYPHVPDTNFNWWLGGYHLVADFGPRQRPGPDDPWFELNCGGLGTPVGDKSKYYILSHREWDYDMFQTPAVGSSDSVWLPPPASDSLGEFWRGADARMFMSIGPVDLPPGGSQRVVWAVFAGDWVHVDPDNALNLSTGRLPDYYDGLHFDIFRRTAARAVAMSHDILDPLDPPTGLEVTYVAGDSAVVQWDPWVFPEVTGYRLRYSSALPGHGGNGFSMSVPAPTRRTVLRNLVAGLPYVASLTQSTALGESRSSASVLFGLNNESICRDPVLPDLDYTFVDSGRSTVRLSWRSPEGSDYSHYRIFRTTDSSLAANRYGAFVTDRPDTTGLTPVRCYNADGTELCLFAMEAYDSVSARCTEWIDYNPLPRAWYWIAGAVTGPLEGKPSSLIHCLAAPPEADREVLVILAGSGHYDYVVRDSVVAFYERVLEGIDFEFYSYTDSLNSGTVDWRDFTGFKTLLIEDGTGGSLFMDRDAGCKLTPLLADLGHRLIYFGFPPGDERIDYVYEAPTIRYEQESVEWLYLGLDSTVSRSLRAWYQGNEIIDSLAGFRRAVPADGWPLLEYKTGAGRMVEPFTVFFDTDSCLPYTPAFYPNERARVIYDYGSAWPATSHLQGLPCGVEVDNPNGQVHAFSFHLWGIKEPQARQLIDKLLNQTPRRVSGQPIPDRLGLGQNYPNPFNSATTISFTLPAWSVVSLKIYNVLGRKVATLIDGQTMPDGVTHSVQWDGTTETGAGVSSGVYFYRLAVGGRVETRKMMLVR